MHKKLASQFTLSLVFIVMSLPILARAADAPRSAFRMTTSPVTQNLNILPGESKTTELRVRNDSDKPARIVLSIATFGAEGEEGKPLIKDLPASDPQYSWITFSDNDFVANPGEWKTIKMTITPPKSAAFGHYFAIKFSRVGDDTRVKGYEVLAGSNAILSLIDVVSPDAKRDIKIVDFSVARQVYEFLPAEFKARFQNIGNTHSVVSGSIFIMSGKKQIAAIDVNKTGGNILPGSYRVFPSAWNDGFPNYRDRMSADKPVQDEKGNTKKELTWDYSQLSKLRIGYYTAHMVVTYRDNDDRDVPLEATVGFWLIPWRIIFGFIFMALFLIVGMYVTSRKVWQRSKRHK